MSSVQAVIAALNQQNNQNDKRQPSNRQSIKDRFGTASNATIDLKTHRSSHMEKRSMITTTTNVNRPSSSFVPLRHDSLIDSTSRTKLNHQQPTTQQLVEKVEKMNAEINQLKQQLHGKAIDTPKSRACELPETEMTTLPPASFIWFDIDGDTMDHNSTENHLLSQEADYDDIIADYNCHIFIQGQQQQRINTLQSQLVACEIGTQWMMSKYLGELELERLRTRSLDTIVQSQEDLIDIMEIKSVESADQSYQKQQIFLLHSQLELQRMELDDKQEMMTLMADERDILVKKIKRLTQLLQQQQQYTNPASSQQQGGMEQTERRPKNHPRTVSSSSTCSTSSYNTTVSSTSMSCIDWANINGMQHHNQSTYLLSSFSKPPPIAAAAAAANLYSPPQTPPPREKLPPLPTFSSSSSMTTTPNLSPRSTVLSAAPSLSSSLATLESSSSTSSDYQRYLPHQNSMPDIRSHHDQQQYHRRATHHYRRDSGDPSLEPPTGGYEKGTMRQKSFWKGWRQRLSS